MVIQIPSSDIGENALKNHDSYYLWLCKQSGINGPLAHLFYETEFRWDKDIPDDENRAKVAAELREQYAQHLLVGEDGLISPEMRKKIDIIVKSILGPVCVFEVLVSLSQALDGLLNMDEEPHVDQYFSILMSNVGFDFYDDEDHDGNPEKVDQYWKKLMDRWLDRTFLPDGEGSLFPLDLKIWRENGESDQRKKPIWEQLNEWVIEQNFDDEL